MSPAPDPEDENPRPKGLPLGFWLAMGFTALCILAAVIVRSYGPVLFPLKPPGPPAQTPAKARTEPPLGNPAPPR